jgi:hypothetical protein
MIHSTPATSLQNKFLVSLVYSEELWFIAHIKRYVLIMINQLIKMNTPSKWLVLLLHYFGCHRVWRAENLRFSIIFLKPSRQMLD